MEATNAGSKSCRASEEGTGGANSARDRGEAAKGDPSVEEAAPRQKGQRGKKVCPTRLGRNNMAVSTNSSVFVSSRLDYTHAVPVVKADPVTSPRRDLSPNPNPSRAARHDEKLEVAEKKNDPSQGNHANELNDDDHDHDHDNAPIIPWRAQLRKTNSKLNILD